MIEAQRNYSMPGRSQPDSLTMNSVKSSAHVDEEIIMVDDYSKEGMRDIQKREMSPVIGQLYLHNVSKGKDATAGAGVYAATCDTTISQGAVRQFDLNRKSLLDNSFSKSRLTL